MALSTLRGSFFDHSESFLRGYPGFLRLIDLTSQEHKRFFARISSSQPIGSSSFISLTAAAMSGCTMGSHIHVAVLLLAVVMMCSSVSVHGAPSYYSAVVRHDVPSHSNDHSTSVEPSVNPSQAPSGGDNGGQQEPPQGAPSPSTAPSEGNSAPNSTPEGVSDSSPVPSPVPAEPVPSSSPSGSDHDSGDHDEGTHVEGDGSDTSVDDSDPLPSFDEEGEEQALASDEVSPDSGEVCVDARHLSRFSAHQLVHPIESAPIADVLCPAHATLPCGTPDHLLVVRGVATSYRDFCSTAADQCFSARMAVNSVLSHLWLDEQHAGEITLTMLDARHSAFLQRLLHRTIAFTRTFSTLKSA